MGDSVSYMMGLSHGSPKNSNSVRPCASDVPYHDHQLEIMRSACAALKRSVFTVIHAVITPPYDPPVTPIFVESTSARAATMSVAFIRSS